VNIRNDIQGLRAIAVLAVIAYHIKGDFLLGGLLGVDLFFVISGFLITSIILKQKNERTFSFVTFYLNRIRRILPAYLFFIFVSAVTFSVLFTSQGNIMNIRVI